MADGPLPLLGGVDIISALPIILDMCWAIQRLTAFGDRDKTIEAMQRIKQLLSK